MNRTSLGLLLALCAILFALTACNGAATTVEEGNIVASPEADSADNIAPSPAGDVDDDVGGVATLEASIAVRFESIEDLAKSADAIVIGAITASEPLKYHTVPFTLSDFTIEAVISGAVAPGDVIRVLETGGLSAGRSKIPGEEGKLAEPVEVALEGVPVMKTGERWLVFLWQYAGGVADSAYIPAGEFQGKFRIGETGIVEFTGPRDALDKAHFTTPRVAEGVRLDDLVKEIEAALARES